jgi:glycine/D-amino acid oxidase-like deaminating enzyme
MDVQYQPAPGMTIPMTEDAWEHLKQVAPGGGHTIISGDAARELEPGLGPEVMGAAWEPLRRKLDSQALTKTYARAAELNGATVQIAAATGFRSTNGRITGVETPDGVVECGAVVLAMGIDAAYAGDWLGVRIPVIPIKGEALRLNYAGPRANHLMTPLGFRPGYVEAGHVIFRKDGVVSVGSTIEDSGYENRPTEAARERIMRMARYLWPALADATLKEQVWGLRPVPADGLPILGPVPGYEGAYIISGHSVCACSAMYAEITTDLVTKGKTDAVDTLEPFSLTRFDGKDLDEIEVFGIVRHLRQAASTIEQAYPSPRR